MLDVDAVVEGRNRMEFTYENEHDIPTATTMTMEEIIEEMIEDDLVEENDAIVEDGIDTISSSSSSNSKFDDPNDDTTTKTKEDMRLKLKEELKQYRTDQSAPLKKPPYTVFTNAALDGICATLPSTDDELLEVKGIGPKKMESYGEDILDIVRQHVNEGLLPDEERISQQQTASTLSAIPRPKPITIESLTPEQRRAADMVLESHQSVFISGAAGTGKSHVSKYIIQTLHERGVRKCSPTAPTGVAALNVGGSTLHAFFGIGLGIGSVPYLVKKARKNAAAKKRIDETDVLLIDEVSMLSSDLLETLDAVAREVRLDGTRKDEPMGGMQVVAVGDFFQLPPIVSRDYVDRSRDMDEQRPFCFDSHVWSELGLGENTIELAENQRQERRSKFEVFLNMVRVGDVTPGIIRDFNAKCLLSGTRTLPDDGIVPTRIYTHNRDVDEENEARLAELEGDLIACAAVDEWREKMPAGTLASVKKGMKAGVAGEMPDAVNLKVGAQVMLTRNKDLESSRGLVNGSRGVVERFDSEGLPFVRFDNGRVDKIGRVEAIRYNPDGGPGVLVRKQIPLKLAWATTVHKSQGSTLTRAILDISKTFEPGQAYVSLSRVKSIDGLYLERPMSMNNIMVSRRVLDYYE